MLRLALLTLMALQVRTSGPIEVDEHKRIAVDSAVESPEGEGWTSIVQWEVSDPENVEFDELDNGHRIHAWAAPGEYTLTQRVTFARIGEGQRIEFQTRKLDYQLFVRPTRPKPGPNPPVPPPPNPTEAVAWVVVLRDLATDTPSEAELLLKLRNWNQWQNPPPQVLILDRDQETPDGEVLPVAKQYADLVPEDAGSPYVFGVGKSGTVLKSFEMPASVEAIVEALK